MEEKNIDYKELYYHLFNKITDIIKELSDIQASAEELYINSEIEKNIDDVTD